MAARADDLALLLIHALATALADVDPLDDAPAAIDRAVFHAGSLAPPPARSQRENVGMPYTEVA